MPIYLSVNVKVKLQIYVMCFKVVRYKISPNVLGLCDSVAIKKFQLNLAQKPN